MDIDGNKLSKKIYNQIKLDVSNFIKKGLRAPHLTVILVGDNPASQIYVNTKQKRCQETGIKFTLVKFDKTVSEIDLIKKIIQINKNKKIDGLIVQLPLPKHLNTEYILSHISPDKDVDGLHPCNLGKLVKDQDTFPSCTPAGVLELIKTTNTDLAGKKAVVIGRSTMNGKPAAFLLLRENCTVTICHSKTKNLQQEVKNADIVVAAIGKPEMIKGAWIKKGAIVIDVGMNRVEDSSVPKGYRLLGDVEYKTAKRKASYITPVPGGVGPMTVAMLLKNTVKAYQKSK